MSVPARDVLAGCTVALGDVPARLWAADRARARAIVGILGDLPADPRPARIDITFETVAPEIGARPPTEEHGPLRLWRDGDTMELSYVDRVFAVATAGGIVLGGGDEVDLADAWRYIFHFGLPHVLALHDLFVLHAAALVDHGSAVLVFGESGAGKSTLVLAARDAGWGALSDDLVVLRRRDRGLDASGIGKPFRVPGDVLDPASGGSSTPLEDDRARWVIEHFPWDLGWFPVRGSIVVGHGQAPEADLAVLPATETVEIALQSFVGLGDPQHLQRWFPIAAEIGRMGGYRLHHSSDATRRVSEAARVLDALGPRLA